MKLKWDYPRRFEHTQVVGSSGAGKTNLLSHLILIDPKRTMIDKLSHLAIFNDKL